MSDGLNRVARSKEHKEAISKAQLDVLTGKRFGRLTVLLRARNDKQGKPQWYCWCSCGNTTIKRSTVLRNGTATSCGCFAREETIRRASTHGMTKTVEWAHWKGIRCRCANPNTKHYHQRGIRVCDRWNSFENFLADMGQCPTGYTIDRIDNSKGYEPGNCRWATVTEQNRNKTSNVWITHNGETMLAVDWSRRLGISIQAVLYRHRKGLQVDTPLCTGGRKFQHV